MSKGMVLHLSKWRSWENDCQYVLFFEEFFQEQLFTKQLRSSHQYLTNVTTDTITAKPYIQNKSLFPMNLLQMSCVITEDQKNQPSTSFFSFKYKKN